MYALIKEGVTSLWFDAHMRLCLKILQEYIFHVHLATPNNIVTF